MIYFATLGPGQDRTHELREPIPGSGDRSYVLKLLLGKGCPGNLVHHMSVDISLHYKCQQMEGHILYT